MQQMRVLRERGFRPVLACRPQSRVMEVACQRGLEVLPLRFRNSLHLPSILALHGWMRRHRPRLAICHSGHDSNNLAIAARLMGRGRPFLLRSRTYQPGKASAWSYNQLVDATMLPSAYLKRCLLENPAIRADKLHVVYPASISPPWIRPPRCPCRQRWSNGCPVLPVLCWCRRRCCAAKRDIGRCWRPWPC